MRKTSADEKHQRLTRLSKRLYRALLSTYPKDFRREYGVDMVQLFRDQCQEEPGSGGVVAWVLLWFQTLVELVGSTRRERDRARINQVPFEREPSLAVVLSLLLFLGLGQIYNRQMYKGSALGIFGLVGIILMFSLPGTPITLHVIGNVI